MIAITAQEKNINSNDILIKQPSEQEEKVEKNNCVLKIFCHIEIHFCHPLSNIVHK